MDLQNVYQLDFNVESSDPLVIMARLANGTIKHDVKILAVSFRGPGGGNPTALFVADADNWERFVRYFYFDNAPVSEDDIELFLEPDVIEADVSTLVANVKLSRYETRLAAVSFDD